MKIHIFEISRLEYFRYHTQAMNEGNKIIVAWSGGKDSALVLYELKQIDTSCITALLTTVTEEEDRISTHGVRCDLLRQQAESLGYPLEEVRIPRECPNTVYEDRMQEALQKYTHQGVSTIAFGDLFLEDIRAYRENQMRAVDMKPIFPLWLKNTEELAHQCIRIGFRAIVSCVDTHRLAPEFSGREYNEDFIRDLPEGVDPCGENGEFHSFVYDGPIFRIPVPVKPGAKEMRNERFCYCDIS